MIILKGFGLSFGFGSMFHSKRFPKMISDHQKLTRIWPINGLFHAVVVHFAPSICSLITVDYDSVKFVEIKDPCIQFSEVNFLIFEGFVNFFVMWFRESP